MGSRRSRHNKGRKPFYKEHGQPLLTDLQIVEQQERDAAVLFSGDRSETTESSCSRCGTQKYAGSVGLCKGCYTRGSAFLRKEGALNLSLAQIDGLSEAAAYELFKQIRWPESGGGAALPRLR